jgi:hypothetical protein
MVVARRNVEVCAARGCLVDGLSRHRADLRCAYVPSDLLEAWDFDAASEV